ncbi:MAG: endo-1,4-beta-xylanase [Planctomycetota bacterium]
MAHGQDLSHRQTELDLRVVDSQGQAVGGANVDLTMLRHDFRFGTEINSTKYLTDSTSRFVVSSLFNSVTFTGGLYWRITEELDGDGVDNYDRLLQATALADANNIDVRGHTIIWPQNKGWLNPEDTLPQYTYKPWLGPDPVFNNQYNPSAQDLQDRISGRIDAVLNSTLPSGNAYGAYIYEFDATNETIDQESPPAPGIDAERVDIFSPRLVDAGLYPDRIAAMADWYVQMDAARPDARLVFNETAILAPSSDAAAIELRDLVQSLLDAGAPIDAIGVQMHMFAGLRSLSDLNRKINILAETGLPVEITEFDNFDGGAYNTNSARQSFENALRVAFENPNVSGFTLWGFEDGDHWVGNSPLFDSQLNLKPEGQPYYDLVLGEWWTTLTDQTTDAQGQTEATLTRGTYRLDVEHNGQTITQEFIVTTATAALEVDVDAGLAYLLGDMNGDDTLSIDDALVFALALGDGAAYQSIYGLDAAQRGDINGDGQFSLADVQAFAAFFEPGQADAFFVAIPEPTTAAVLTLLAAGTLGRPRRR